MSIKIKKEITNKEKQQSSNLISIIEKYYLPKDISISDSKKQNSKNIDTDLSDYLSILSISQNNLNYEKIKKNTNEKNINVGATPNPNLQNKLDNTNNIFMKIFRNYIVPYFTLKDLISLKHTNKMFNILIDKKAINLCTISNTINPIKSHELRAKIWYHYLNIKEIN